MRSWKRQVKKRSSNCNSQNISVLKKEKKKTLKKNKSYRINTDIPWISSPVHCIYFCKMSSKCSSSSHLYSTDSFNIMCYLKSESNSTNYTTKSQEKKVITRSWVIQRAQDIVFTKLNPTAFCFLHWLTCVRDVSHTAFLASCWKKKRNKSHWCIVGQLKRFICDSLNCINVGVPCNTWLPRRKHKKCSYQRYTG